MARKPSIMKRAELEGKTYLMVYEEFQADNKLKNLSENTIKYKVLIEGDCGRYSKMRRLYI